MINILFYIGMTLQSEVCLWTLLGLLRTIFDATLFKVNANLKQVWQMKMPCELTLPVQRVLRTMISGVMLVQCFTVYVYLASYIVLLYPVFLEERPTLVLPWLLLAAVRNLLCELTSLALGLGTCVLLGPARPACIKFVLIKLASIMPAFYMWMLLFGYYHFLKVTSPFKGLPTLLPAKDLDYGLELAVRRRRTKTLLHESQVRKKLMDSLSYCDQASSHVKVETRSITKIGEEAFKNSLSSSDEDIKSSTDVCPMPVIPNRTMSDIGTYEDWFGSEVNVPRDTDRILEQIVLMLLRIGVFLTKENVDMVKFLGSGSQIFPKPSKLECMPAVVAETPPLVGSSKGKMASYLRDYPQIFQKKPSGLLHSLSSPNRVHDNNLIIESCHSPSSSQSSVTIEKPLDSVSLKSENKNNFLSEKEGNKSSRSFIHSHDEIDSYFQDDKNNIIKFSDISEESKSLQVDSRESIKSILNRMIMRAASSEHSFKDVDESETSNNSDENNKVQSHTQINKDINKNKQK